MKFLRIPAYAAAWYADRLRRIHEKDVARWAVAEMVCMSLALLSLVLLIVLSILRAAGVPPVPWVSSYVLPIMIAGAVGYLTNLIAITMLFRPYGPEDKHPVGSIPTWKQGLVTKHRTELAEKAGRQVADNLLTPETIADEIKVLLDRALRDEDLQDKLRRSAGPVIREKLPVIVDSISPEIMRFLRGVVAAGLTRDNMVDLMDTSIQRILKSESGKRQLADWVTENVRMLLPEIVELLQDMARKYRDRGFWKRTAMWAAEKTRALDWEEVRDVIEQKLAEKSTRDEIIDLAEGFVLRLRESVGGADMAPTVRHLQDHASDFVVTVVEDHLDKALPELGHRIADDRTFWRWLTEEGLPLVYPYIVSWLDGEGIAEIKNNFDVAGRVTNAINEMDVKQVHEIINDASARHLGAIQVLGYILGTVAGICLLLV